MGFRGAEKSRIFYAPNLTNYIYPSLTIKIEKMPRRKWMGLENFKANLLLTTVIASLVASALALTATSSAKVYEDVNSIFIRGGDNAYGNNLDNVQPIKLYGVGDLPPFAMFQRIGSGAVIAFGSASTCRGGITYTPQRWVRGELDVLLDVMFQWMVPGATKVLWYGDYTSTSYELVYNDAKCCSWLIDDLKENFGYTIDDTIDGVFTPIDDALLASYQILVLPQLQLGGNRTGGDPSQLPDSVVDAIKNFVNNGGGLLLMESSDFQGYNYYKVSNKILEGLNFNSRGENRYFGFQSDAIYDDSSNHGANQSYWPRLVVDNTTEIGSKYQKASGKTTVDVYSPCSLVEIGPSIVMYVIPEYEVGMPGETLTYRVRVFNSGNADLTINLRASDGSGWGPTFDNSSVGLLKPGENRTRILSVTVPSSARMSSEDAMVVTATAVEYPDLSSSVTCIAHVAKRLEVTEDSYVDDSFPDQNFGDKEYLYIGRYTQNYQYAFLKFDNLDQIPSDAVITSAKLYLFCWRAYGIPQGYLCSGVVDDSWTELDITWNNMPSLGATLDTTIVTSGTELHPEPYSWDVTSFVQQQFEGDKIASFCIRPPDNCPESTNRRFEARDWWDSRLRPFLQVIYTSPTPGVSVSVRPVQRSGLPGTSLSYTVTVTNGSVSDTYSLTASDNAGWGPTISPPSLSLAAGATGRATLTVPIPSGASIGTIDNVRVIVTGTSARAETSCIAQVSNLAVEVSISPPSQDGSPGAPLTYTVTVKNAGAVADNYLLTASDNAGWSLNLSPTTLSLAAGASGTATLTVTIPSGAGNNVYYDSIVITATSRTDSSVSAENSCIARTGGVAGKGVRVAISPASSSGNPGTSLKYTVTVTNTGTTTDTFLLEPSDTEGWGPTLSITPPRITLREGESRTLVLTIKIPSNASQGESSTITVRATSQTDAAITGENTCTATVESGGGISPFVYVAAAIVIVAVIAVIVVVRPF
jgi:uncharacterized membrane protein